MVPLNEDKGTIIAISIGVNVIQIYSAGHRMYAPYESLKHRDLLIMQLYNISY